MRPRTGRSGAQIPAGAKYFFPNVQTNSRAHPASNKKGTGDSSSGDTAAGSGSENYLNIVLKLGMSSNIPPLPLNSGYRENFTFCYGLKYTYTW
jgi:hypothetical protein